MRPLIFFPFLSITGKITVQLLPEYNIYICIMLVIIHSNLCYGNIRVQLWELSLCYNPDMHLSRCSISCLLVVSLKQWYWILLSVYFALLLLSLPAVFSHPGQNERISYMCFPRDALSYPCCKFKHCFLQ